MKQVQYIRLLPLCFLMTLAACAQVYNGGYVGENDIRTQVTVGQSSKEDVRTKLGSPSSQSSFGDEAWYYITNQKKSYAFLKPKLVQQDVVRIVFDGNGLVSKIETYDKNNSGQFEIAKRTTPTEGHTLGFVEQVLGNIGRFNRPGNDSSVAPGRRPGS